MAATAGLGIVLAAHAATGPPSTAAAVAAASQRGKASPHSSPGAAPSGTAPAGAGRLAPGTATGAMEQYGYGEFSVKVSVANGKLVQATAVGLKTADSYSQQIAQQVIPMLRREVLSAQSARISAVTGATYTSEAYAASVQSALDKLHAK
ncbi:MAG: FMN-binding protein [Acidimicrobiales bacterium]